MQENYEYFNPEDICAPVAIHRTLRCSLRMLLQKLILEGADVDNTYLYSTLDIPIIMEQNTDSTQKLNEIYSLCMLVKSFYGAWKASKIWGSVIDKDLKS